MLPLEALETRARAHAYI